MFRNQDMMEHTDRLRRFALRLTKNMADAEDLLQSTILRALEKRHLFKDNTNLYGWLCKIMFRLFANNYRRRVKYESQYEADDYIQNISIDAKQNDELEIQDVGHAMERLSKEHKDILVMVSVKGMSYDYISRQLKIPVGTVRSRLSRARENLRAILESKPVFIAPREARLSSRVAA